MNTNKINDSFGYDKSKANQENKDTNIRKSTFKLKKI